MKTSAIFAAIFLFFSNSAWSQTSSSSTPRTELDICIDRETNKYISDNNKDGKFTSLDQLLQTEKLRIQASLKAKCVLEAQKTANQLKIQQQQAAAAKASGASGATTAAAAGAGATMTAPLLEAAVKAIPDDRKPTAPAQAAPAVATATQPAASRASPQAGARAPGAGETAVGGGSITTSTQGSSLGITTESGDSNTVTSTGAASAIPSSSNFQPDNTGLSSAEAAAQQAVAVQPVDLSAATSSLGASAEQARAVLPGVTSAASQLVGQANGGGATAPATEITGSANAMNAQLNAAVKALEEPQKFAMVSEPGASYIKTSSLITKLATEIQSYQSTAKQACVKTAEATEFLCIEGTSPGAIAARKVMDVAGPILAVINSAQKACSGSAKVSKMVSEGLTVAKGVCVAAKLSCDGACLVASSKFKTILTMASTEIETALVADANFANAECSKYLAAASACQIANNKKLIALKAQLAAIHKQLATEMTLVKGTTPGIAARCQSHIKDILLFAVNLAGMKKAQKSAEACEKQLASSGGSTITPTQYCETPANVSTQFCLCQKDNTATGCPGALAKTTSPGGTDVGGVNIKSAGGTSAFASGFRTSKPNSILNKNGSSLSGSGLDGGSNLNTATQAGGAVGTADPSHLEGAGAQGVSGGYAGDSGSNDSKSGKAIGSDKKWNFGSFGSSGGSSGSYGNAGISANGALSAKQMEAVKRQIASEQLAAEVSSATGKSNWEKVQQRYLMNTNSFLSGR